MLAGAVWANDYSPVRAQEIGRPQGSPLPARFAFPALPGAEVRCYYFRGAELDSLVVNLDAEGRGNIVFPEGYRGYVQAVVNRVSLVEFIAGEEVLVIESNDPRPDNRNVHFPGSEENGFFFGMMERKKTNEQEKAWITSPTSPPALSTREGAPKEGETKEWRKLRKALKGVEKANAKEAEQIEKEIAASPLYAARFIEIADFADALFYAENQRDTAKMACVKEYLHNRMDWKTLYTAGQFWTMVHNYTLSMFNKEDPARKLHETQQLYAEFVSPLLKKTEEPMRSAMLQSIVKECEAFGWELAKTEVVEYIVNNNVMIAGSSPGIQRIMQGHRARAGEKAPHLSPAPSQGGGGDLSPGPSPQERGEKLKIILSFYEPGCDNCERELQALEENRVQLEEQGYRIITISSEDEGATEAFRDYGIMSTPTFFMIDEEGIIEAREAQLQELTTSPKSPPWEGAGGRCFPVVRQVRRGNSIR